MASRRTILCVDDNAALVDNLCEILEDASFAVRRAANCAEALTQARLGFDVALVDVKLPDGDGTVLAAELRESAPDSQVILLTGFAALESAVAAVRAGAWAYLLKPCATPDLLLAVGQAIRQIEVLEEKHELERRTRIAEKLAAIGTMTAGLSHEIKNPLNAAGIQLAVLERRILRLPADAQAPLREPLLLVQDEVTRLNRVLEQFLQFARPRGLAPESIDLVVILEQVVDLMDPLAADASVRLDRCWSRSVPLIGDRELLHQAVMNLVLNAIQATPPGGSVAIEADMVDGDAQLAIDDSGPGIPDTVRARIFEPFFTTKAAGSGLGLPMVHSIVEQHGGSIAIVAGRRGGARFEVKLPGVRPLDYSGSL